MFEKEFSDKEFLEKCNTYSEITILRNESSEKRNNIVGFLDELDKTCFCNNIVFSYDPDEDKIAFDSEKRSLSDGMKKLLEGTENSPLLIVISTMNLHLLGTLLRHLKYSKHKEVFCVYTEPKRYARNTEPKRDFDLYRRMKSFDPIPGFVSMNYDDKPEKWIPFLGFEGDRALQVREQYDFDDYVPVLTLPSYKPIWQNFIIRENMILLDGVKDNSIHYVEADSVLAAYEELDSLAKTYRDKHLRVTSFGTKINALGILLFSLSHEGTIDIIYDNPVEDGAAFSEEVGETHVFDISEFIEKAREAELT